MDVTWLFRCSLCESKIVCVVSRAMSVLQVICMPLPEMLSKVEGDLHAVDEDH